MILFIIANNILKMIKNHFYRMFQIKPHLLSINSWSTKFRFWQGWQIKMQLTEGAQNCPFLILIIFPVLAAATRRSVCCHSNIFVLDMQNEIFKCRSILRWQVVPQLSAKKHMHIPKLYLATEESWNLYNISNFSNSFTLT